MANMEEAKRLYDKGLGHYRAGEYEEALAALTRAREEYGAAGDHKSEGDVLNDMGVVCVQLEEWESAQSYLDEALTIRLALPDRSGQAMTLGNMGTMYERQDQDDKAAQVYEQAITIFRDLGEKGNEKAIARQMRKLKLQKGQFLDALSDYHGEVSSEEAPEGSHKLARRLFRILGRVGGGPALPAGERAGQDEPDDKPTSA